MPTIEHLPRPWLLAAMTGVPVSVLVGTERCDPEAEARDTKRPRARGDRAELGREPAPKPSRH